MPELTIIATPSSSILTVSFPLEATVGELKLALKALLDGEAERMVCGGRVLREDRTLQEQGVKEKSKIYVAVTGSGSVSRSAAATSAAARAPAKPREDPLMGPLLKFLASNPELYQQMLLSNPHLQGLLESNPELRHALSDPSTLKSILSAATNPAAYNEMLRGHDRALSNLENIPEGFSHLKRVYSTMQEPMYEALTPKYRHRTPPSTDETVRKELTNEPVPNPWAPMSHTGQDGLGLGFPLFHTASGAASGSGAASAFASGSGSASIASSAPLLQRPAAGLTPSSPRGSLKRKLPASSASASSLDASPEEDYSAQLETLHGLGFLDDDGENRPALEVAKGNLSAAIDWIMKHRQK